MVWGVVTRSQLQPDAFRQGCGCMPAAAAARGRGGRRRLPILMPAGPSSDARCTHPGELAFRVMTTHPVSVHPDSEARERRLKCSRRCTGSAFEAA
jgi:hypothetical protein